MTCRGQPEVREICNPDHIWMELQHENPGHGRCGLSSTTSTYSAMLEGSYEGYEDAHVTVLDKLTYAGNRGNIPAAHKRLDFILGDICDTRLLLEVLPGHDAVVHFAAESHVDRSIGQAPRFVHTNVAGTQALLGACLQSGVKRFVQVSTDEVYGSIEKGFAAEAARAAAYIRCTPRPRRRPR